jgi:hypothetical protein
MFFVSVATLAKVIKSTYRNASQYLVLYAILMLSVLSWGIIGLTFIGTTKTVYTIGKLYLAV